jgi:hypothetical protein
MPKANRVHCTQRRIQIKNGRRRNDRSRNLSTNFTPCRFSTTRIIAPRTSSRPAITRLTARRVNPDAKHHIRHDSRGFKERHCHRLYGSDRGALATVMPKAEPIVPMKAPGCHWEFHGDAIGISESLYVFGAGVAAGYAGAVC